MYNDHMKTIYIAAGCFWGTQAYYQKIKGVISTETGYANGPTSKVTYEQVCNASGHVEVVKVTFKESILFPQDIFDSFIRIIDPYSKNKQANDQGIQYRIGLYFDDQKLLLQIKKILLLWETNNHKSEVEILPLKNYIKAEMHHQNYLSSNPNGYCHINLNDIPRNLKKPLLK